VLVYLQHVHVLPKKTKNVTLRERLNEHHRFNNEENEKNEKVTITCTFKNKKNM
jgi:hypothetical protein